MSPNLDTYSEVTSKILEALDRGVAPWRQPWTTSAPRNVRSGRPYRGINTLLLGLEARTDPRWGTFKAWQEIGASVRKGEKSTKVILWKKVRRRRSAEELGAGDEPSYYGLMRAYSVFNAEQVDGAPELELGEPFEPLERAEEILAGMPNRPEIRHGGDSAYYSPSSDTVTLPAPESFEPAAAYYGVAFHELTHATGAEHRLGGLELGTFGSDPYAREELVAELGSAMLAGIAELELELEASASYIECWRRRLEADPKLIVSAAGEAQRRADYILGVRWGEDSGAVDAEAPAVAA